MGEDAVAEQLAPYLKHRRTGRPWVVLKLAATLDGGTAAPDGTSRWITGEEARADAHRLRARSDAVVVGAGTVRADDPALTVRLPEDDPWFRGPDDQPLRVVLGRVPPGAAVAPALELTGEPGEVLDELGRRGVLRCWWRGAPRWPTPSTHAGVWWTATSSTSPPPCSAATTPDPLFAGPGASTMDRAVAGSTCTR